MFAIYLFVLVSYNIFLSTDGFVHNFRGGTGYFWHVTDIHLDKDYEPLEKGCLQKPDGLRTAFGQYGCGSSWKLANSAIEAMKNITGDTVEFILWTGDIVGDTTSNTSTSKNLIVIKQLSYLLKKYFSASFVFPVIGHLDPLPYYYKNLSDIWNSWLPPDTVETFSSGGYYSVEQKHNRLLLVIVNTYLMMSNSDSSQQWIWLENIMEAANRKGHKVYIVGHIPPGFVHIPSKAIPKCLLSDENNEKYIKIINKYKSIISGQFFGHLHVDTFRIFYDASGNASSFAFVSPSLSPRDGNNPAIRLYHIDLDTGYILGYKQYYLDLNVANRNNNDDWRLEYEFNVHYGIANITPDSLHKLAHGFMYSERTFMLERYLQVYNTRGSKFECDVNIRKEHYCAITKLSRAEYEKCMENEDEREYECGGATNDDSHTPKAPMLSTVSILSASLQLLFYHSLFFLLYFL